MHRKSLRLLLESSLSEEETFKLLKEFFNKFGKRFSDISPKYRRSCVAIFKINGQNDMLPHGLLILIVSALSPLSTQPNLSPEAIKKNIETWSSTTSLKDYYTVDISALDIKECGDAMDRALSVIEDAESNDIPDITKEDALDIVSMIRDTGGDGEFINKIFSIAPSKLLEDEIAFIKKHDPELLDGGTVQSLLRAMHIGKFTNSAGVELFYSQCKAAYQNWESANKLWKSSHGKKFIEKLQKMVEDAIKHGMDDRDFVELTNSMREDPFGNHGSEGMLYYRLDTIFSFASKQMKLDTSPHSKTGIELVQLYKYFNSGAEALAFVEYAEKKLQVILDQLDGLKSASSEANPRSDEKPFGDFVFAPVRRNKVPREPNTLEEDEIYDQLYKHVENNRSISQSAALRLMQLLDDETYPSIIHEPAAEFVYRGIKVGKNLLEKIIGAEIDKDAGSAITRRHISTREGSEGSTAWTTDIDAARLFSVPAFGSEYSVIMVAKKSENPSTFLEGPTGFYKVPTLATYEKTELETIALGPVKLYKVYWKRGAEYPGGFEKGDIKEGKMESKMKTKMGLLRRVIREMILREADIADVSDMCFTAGSTHVMKTCKIGGNSYFLKFSDEGYFEGTDPSLQILIEYLAYRIYGLFSGINIPRPVLVYDSSRGKVGLATTPASGKMALKVGTDPKFLAKMMSQGVYVDVFLANWDVIGTGSGNVFVDDDKATRIDPGGSLTFRAQGGRKGKAFGPKVGELSTMLKGGSGAGNVYRYVDLKVAAREFLSVKWSDIESEIDTVRNEVSDELKKRGMKNLLQQWNDDVDLIKSTLSQRHDEVVAHANAIMSGEI